MERRVRRQLLEQRGLRGEITRGAIRIQFCPPWIFGNFPALEAARMDLGSNGLLANPASRISAVDRALGPRSRHPYELASCVAACSVAGQIEGPLLVS